MAGEAKEETEIDNNKAQSRGEVRPAVMLAVLTAIFSLIFMDRGVIASNSVNGKRRTPDDPDGSGFQGEFDLSNFQDGLLLSMYMVGVLIGSPLFSQAVHYYNPLRLVGYGILVWTLAVGLCGVTIDFYTMSCCRMFVGFGEAGVIAIGPTYIDDRAPKKKVSLWLSILLIAVPAGYALGFIFSVAMTALFGWRGAFIAEAVLMLPFVIFCFVIKPITLNMGNSTAPEVSGPLAHLRILWNDTKTVMSHPVYSATIVANVFHVGVMGMIAYWGAKAANAMFDVNGMDLWIGGTILVTGTVGTVMGGYLLDLWGSSITKALYICTLADVIAGCLLIPAFLFIKNFYVFLVPYTLAFTSMFLQTGPVSALFLWSVPLHLRPLSTSINIIVHHVLGDMPSPAISGLLLDIFEDDIGMSDSHAYSIVMSISAGFMVLAGILFYVAAYFGKTAKDYRAGLQHHEEGVEDAPLLQSSTAMESASA